LVHKRIFELAKKINGAGRPSRGDDWSALPAPTDWHMLHIFLTKG
jgi:hypothetical protein